MSRTDPLTLTLPTLWQEHVAPHVGPSGWDSNLTRSLYGAPSGPARTQVLNYGGGVQTTALLALVLTGRLPRPDHIVMADTGREGTATWEWLHGTVAPRLASEGLRVEIAPHDLATVDLLSHQGSVLMPMFTDSVQKGNGLGRLPTFCSTEWKTRVVRRYLRSLGITQADCWIGYSADESERLKRAAVEWARSVFPLLDLGLSRQECEGLALEVFGARAPKSSCYMCPHRGDAQWRDLRDNYPADWQEAVATDYAMRAVDPHVYLHRSGVALDQAVLGDTPDAVACSTDGGCWT